MNKRCPITGRFLPNENTWDEDDNNVYCYLNGELLFFTDKTNSGLFEGHSISKIADGYSAIRLNGKEIPVHRYVSNAKEGDIVDHINRNKKDNRLSNLRLTDKSGNAFNSGLRRNNTSGVTGVWFRKDTKRWTAEIKKRNKKISLGCFKTKEEAITARMNAEVEYYGYKLEG